MLLLASSLVSVFAFSTWCLAARFLLVSHLILRSMHFYCSVRFPCSVSALLLVQEQVKGDARWNACFMPRKRHCLPYSSGYYTDEWMLDTLSSCIHPVNVRRARFRDKDDVFIFAEYQDMNTKACLYSIPSQRDCVVVQSCAQLLLICVRNGSVVERGSLGLTYCGPCVAICGWWIA